MNVLFTTSLGIPDAFFQTRVLFALLTLVLTFEEQLLYTRRKSSILGSHISVLMKIWYFFPLYLFNFLKF